MLELTKNAPDLERLKGLEQHELADIYAERLVNGFMQMEAENLLRTEPSKVKW